MITILLLWFLPTFWTLLTLTGHNLLLLFFYIARVAVVCVFFNAINLHSFCSVEILCLMTRVGFVAGRTVVRAPACV